MGQSKQRGLTTVELAIVLGIVAILAAVAYPGYTDYVLRVNRAEAMDQLLRIAAAQERFLFVYKAYAVDLAAPATSALPPLGIKTSTQENAGDTAYYRLSLMTRSGTYRASAVPQGKQTADRCGTLTITHTGARGAAASDCW